MPKITSEAIQEFLSRIDSQAFHVPPRDENLSALRRLLVLVLQEDQSFSIANKCVQALDKRFISLNEPRVARLYEVVDVLEEHQVANSEHKAMLVQEYLRRVFGKQNHLDLDWLLDSSSERRQTLFDEIGCIPAHAAFALDLDSLDEDDEDYEGLPISPSIKRFFSRMGWSAANPKEADIRALIEPFMKGKNLYPMFIALSIAAQLLPVKKPRACPKAAALQEIYKKRKTLQDDLLLELLDSIGFVYSPKNKGFGLSKKKATKKKATKKKATKKKATKKKATKKKATKKKAAKKKATKKKATKKKATKKKATKKKATKKKATKKKATKK